MVGPVGLEPFITICVFLTPMYELWGVKICKWK